MKYIWEEKDIIPGRMVCKPSEKEFFQPDGWTAKWTYMIGYANSTGENPCLVCIGENPCLVCIVDGMISKVYTPKELADRLNRDGMIPMPYSWHLATIEFLRRD